MISVHPLVGAWPWWDVWKMVADSWFLNSSAAEVGQSYASYLDLDHNAGAQVYRRMDLAFRDEGSMWISFGRQGLVGFGVYVEFQTIYSG